MRTVEDPDGNRYLLLERAPGSSRVRDLESGEDRELPTDELVAVPDAPPVETAASSLSSATRRFVTAVPDSRALGLLVALEAADGLAARVLLAAGGYCESDLNGLMSELRAADLVTETTVDGEAGYRLTDEAAAVVRALQSAGTSG
ncbi:MAG: hypothetical protein ABEJ92_04055 [Halobacteriales archaeon]